MRSEKRARESVLRGAHTGFRKTLRAIECGTASALQRLSPMKNKSLSFRLPLTLAATLLALVFSGCSTPAGRITKNQEAFDSWPVEVREKVRAGQVDLGFTPGQVLVALGKPTRAYAHKSENGEAEIWAYSGKSGKWPVGLSIGLGVGRSSGGYWGGGSSTSGAIGISTGSYGRGAADEALRVIFESGVVVAVEARQR